MPETSRFHRNPV